MALTSPMNTAITDTVIFFLLDIPTLWAIERGLLALQAYYFCTQARAGRTVPLARSRIPIVGCDLLRGVTQWPSLLLLINISVLVVMSFATLGVESDTSPGWDQALYLNITTLAMPCIDELTSGVSNAIVTESKFGSFEFVGPQRWNRTRPLFFRETNRENSTCETRNATHVDYWPVAFNATLLGPLNETNWMSNNASCQANATEAKPMLATSCVPVNADKTCSLDTMFQYSLLPILLNESNLSDPTLRHPGQNDLHENRAWNEDMSFSEWNAMLLNSSTSNKDGILQRLVGSQVIYRGVPLNASQTAYIQHPDRDVTSIDLRATILYGLIIALSVVLLPMKELLLYVLVRRGNLIEADLRIHEYDQLSKNYRAQSKRFTRALSAVKLHRLSFPD